MPKGLEHGIGEGLRWRITVVVGGVDFKVRRRGVVGAQGDVERLEGRCGAMLDGEGEAPGMSDEIGIAVGPGKEVGRATQGLSELGTGLLAHVVDQGDGGAVLALELSQETEESGDLCGAVLVEAVQADQRIEQQ